MIYKEQEIVFVNDFCEYLLSSKGLNNHKHQILLSDCSKILSIIRENPRMDIDTLISLAFNYNSDIIYESCFNIRSFLVSSNEIESEIVSDVNKGKELIGKQQNRKYNILIAEDELVNFEVLKMLVRLSLGMDCNIIHAENGQEAIEICRNNPEIDIVLMDIRMPKVTGLEATRQIKEVNPELPIVAQTAYTGEKEKNKAENAGCNDFITKPIEKEILKSILSKYLK